MKKILYILIAAATVFTACKKGDLVESTPYTKINVGDPGYSFLRFINMTPGSPTINYYLNDARISGAYNALTGETGFGYVSSFPISGGQFLPITSGTSKIDAKIVATATADKGVNVLNTNITTTGGKYYSLITTGTYNTVDKKITNSLLLEETKPTLDTSKVLVRIVNLYSGAPANIDMTQKATGQVIHSNIAYNTASSYAEIPLPGQANIYQFNLTGTTTSLTTATLTFTLTKGQAYTIIVRGIAGSTVYPFGITPYASFY